MNHTMPLQRNDEPVQPERYLTDLFSDEAVAFVRRHREQPFFLYLAYNAPHSPWEAPEDEEAKYALDQMTKLEAIPAKFRRTYVAMVTRMDAGVGRLMTTLRDLRMEERTLIFFLSDNGGGKNVGAGGKPGYPSSNHPLRGYKGTLWEGGIRVPFVANWKGVLPAGVTYDQPVSSFDMGATALALAGGISKEMRLDGVNILPHLTGKEKEAPHERLFWKDYKRGAIREGRYKLITGEGNSGQELYDLADDLVESTNLAAGKPELVQQLDAKWKAWNAEMKPPMWNTPPEAEWTKPEYQPPFWPQEKAAGMNSGAPVSKSSSGSSPVADNIAPTHARVSYGEHPAQVMDVWLAHADQATPVVVYIHGGGWEGGSRSGIQKHGLRVFLNAGISVLTIDYRLIAPAIKAGITPPVRWPLGDAARAIQYIRSKVAEWHLDKTRIGLTGGSAGACTSLWLAMHDDMAEPGNADPIAHESTRVSCIGVVDAQTSLDPRQLREWFKAPTYGAHAFGIVKEKNRRLVSDMDACFAQRERILPWIKEYSPIEHASADDPPMLLAYTGVPQPAGQPQLNSVHGAAFGIHFKERMDALGVECHVAYPVSPEDENAPHIQFLIQKLIGSPRLSLPTSAPQGGSRGLN